MSLFQKKEFFNTTPIGSLNNQEHSQRYEQSYQKLNDCHKLRHHQEDLKTYCKANQKSISRKHHKLIDSNCHPKQQEATSQYCTELYI